MENNPNCFHYSRVIDCNAQGETEFSTKIPFPVFSAILCLKTERLGEGGTQTSGGSILPEFTKQCNW